VRIDHQIRADWGLRGDVILRDAIHGVTVVD
jgi:hypothetical protein